MMKQFRVLVVDDEERILNFLTAKLKLSGYDVVTARDGLGALEQVQSQEPDLVVLDIVMPGMDGFEVLKELRTFSSTPVIVLSAKGAHTDRIRGLGMGADDYLPKPFNPDELVARIEAVKRRLAPLPTRKLQDTIAVGDVTIDFKKHQVTVRGADVHLTRIEWLLLSELVQNSGRLMLYDELLTRVWGPEYRDDVHLLRTWVSRLRYKVEKDPNSPTLIRTMPKTGYIIDQPITEPAPPAKK
jgi:two-component system KDP operon response regulator KdpE